MAGKESTGAAGALATRSVGNVVSGQVRVARVHERETRVLAKLDGCVV